MRLVCRHSRLHRNTKPRELAQRGGAWLTAGDIVLRLGVDVAFVPARKAHPVFSCDGYGALLERLSANGVAVAHDPLPFNGHAHCYIADPFGNRIELIATA